MVEPLGDPIAAFYRELLTILHWTFIREEFCTRFLEVFDPEPETSAADGESAPNGRGRGRGGGRGGRGGRGGEVAAGSSSSAPRVMKPSEIIEEKHRFRRHCREALGKWILSQKARDGANLSSYFPTRQSASQPPIEALKTYRDVTGGAGGGATTYDEQLIRDLTMKCTKSARDRPYFADDIRQFIQVTFSLAERCFTAHAAIETAIAGVLRSESGEEPQTKKSRSDTVGAGASSSAQNKNVTAMRPIATLISDESKTSDSQKRIKGDIVELSVDVDTFVSLFGSHFKAHRVSLSSLFYRSTGDFNLKQIGNLTRVIIPRVAWDKLAHLYKNAGLAEDDEKRHSDRVRGHFSAHELEVDGDASTDSMPTGVSVSLLRCATLAYRYEGNLATGSLQLCADESLKTLLVEKGYHVIDLCASPINAFQMTCAERGGGYSTNFCSAFIDTDRPFGSIGSATVVDLKAFVASFCEKVSAASLPPRGFLFTLDVPYDEDLCNILFLKLATDCEVFGSNSSEPAHTHAAFLLVLPLWWDLSFAQAKKVHSLTDKPEDVQRALSSAVAYMDEGYKIAYPWPSVLGSSPWACFDAVFVKDSYSYFCTATNRLLSGVTATEVIGFEDPTTGTALRDALAEFYKV